MEHRQNPASLSNRRQAVVNFEGEEITVQSIATNPGGIANVDLLVDGVTARTDSPTAGQGNLFTVTQKWKATAGTHTLGVRAYGAAGQASDMVSITITVTSSATVLTTPGATRGPTLPATVIATIGATRSPTPLVSSHIAFVSKRDGNQEIYVMNADGSAQTRLTSNTFDDVEPACSPDGTRIAFTSNRDGNWEIYVMNADGSGTTRLTNNSSNEGGPSWSPDGTRVAFFSNRDGNDEIYLMNANGSGQMRLTNNTAIDGYPAWSPEGRRIVFHSIRDGNWEIYVLNTNGWTETRLTNNILHTGTNCAFVKV